MKLLYLFTFIFTVFAAEQDVARFSLNNADDVETRVQLHNQIIPDQYIVVLKSDTVDSLNINEFAVNAVSADPIGQVLHVYDIPSASIFAESDSESEDEDEYENAQNSKPFRGFAIQCSRSCVEKLESDSRVAYVERDRLATVAQTAPAPAPRPPPRVVTQRNAIWNLARLSTRALPYGSSFNYPINAGNRVHIYILDTGVYDQHSELAGRVIEGASFVSGEDWRDRHGHGSHVAGSAAGKTYGVAKRAIIVPVRVLNSKGTGSWSGIIGGINWAVNNAAKTRIRSVINMSIEGGKMQSVNDAVSAAVAARLHVVVAAGNSNIDSCTTSPGSSSSLGAITVGNSNAQDGRTSSSNWGSCVTLFAPGNLIRSCGIRNPTESVLMTGTSMAAPHVAGVIATYLSVKNYRPAVMKKNLIVTGTASKLTDIRGSPNVLLYLDPIGCFNCGTKPAMAGKRKEIDQVREEEQEEDATWFDRISGYFSDSQKTKTLRSRRRRLSVHVTVRLGNDANE